jgi:hypothetical protein
MIFKDYSIVLWLAFAAELVNCAVMVTAVNSTSTTEAKEKAAATSTLVSKTSTPTNAKTTSKGINPALASALADLMAKGGSDSPEANALGAILGGQGGRPLFQPAAAPMAQWPGAGGKGARKFP